MKVNRYKYWSLKNVEVRSILLVFCLLIPCLVVAQSIRTFPYFLPLTGTSKPNEITEGAASANAPTGNNRYTTNGIVLTDDKTLVKSGFALDKLTFTSEFGIIVDFEYAMYGGTTNPGDGMSMFLFDASVPFSLGYAGSGLGYAYLIDPKYPNVLPSVNGVSGGFLGVGLDAWGNYKLKMDTTTQIVEGVIAGRNNYSNDGKNHITIRGGVNTNNKLGYPVIFSTATENTGVDGRLGVTSRLNFSGSYQHSVAAIPKPFTLKTSKDANGVVKYNKVRVIVVPKNSTTVLISVSVTSNNIIYEIVKDFEYVLNTYAPDHNGVIYQTSAKYPRAFKIGFAAGTGNLTQYHVVKNVKVDLPFASEMKEDNVKECISPYGGNSGIDISVFPLVNDKFYVGAIASNPTSGTGTNYMDYSSFRFEDSVGNALYSVSSGNTIYHDQTGVGRWVFDKTTGKVTLTLSQETYGTGTTTHNLKMYYSIKGLATGGGPFNDEYYRSEPTAINVALEKCKTDIEVRINPNMSIEGN